MSYVFPYILLRVKPYFPTSRFIIPGYTYDVALVMDYVYMEKSKYYIYVLWVDISTWVTI